MRLKQQLNLLFLICILLLGIFSINNLNIVSNNKKIKKHSEIKVNTSQKPVLEENLNLQILWAISENEEDDNINKSKTILKSMVKILPKNTAIGLRSFKNKEDEKELFIPINKHNKNNLIQLIKNLHPTGDTSIGYNLLLALKDFENIKGKKMVILITDGKDKGNIMPSTLVNEINKNNIKINIIHVGKINKINQIKLKNLAELGNGKYFTYFEEKEIIASINLN